jgi:hypothetical protein
MTGHEVFTVRYMGWGGLKNGALIAAAEESGMEVFVTGDHNLSYQQNLLGRRMAIVTLSAHNWPIIRDHVQTIAKAVDAAKPGSFQFVLCGEFRKR